jgi:hypothetical protein
MLVTLVTVLKKESPSSAVAKLHACAALRNIASTESNRKALCDPQIGLLPHLTALLRTTDDQELVTVGSGILKNLSTLKANRKVLGARDTGVLEVARDLLASRASVDNALSILRNLAKSIDNLSAMCSSELALIPVLVAATDYGSANGGIGLEEPALSKLCEVFNSFCVSKNLKKFLAVDKGKIGVVGAVVRIFNQSAGDGVRVSAIELLLTFSSVADALAPMCERNNLLLPCIKAALMSGPGKVNTAASSLLMRLCLQEDSRALVVAEEATGLGLGQTLQSTSGDQQSGVVFDDYRVILRTLKDAADASGGSI